MKAIENLRRHDKAMRARASNDNTRHQQFQVGDKVSFYIPPSKPETVQQQKKGKHLLQYRGPADITRVRTPTTYDLEFSNRKYSRATSELRPYKHKQVQWRSNEITPAERDDMHIGQYVAYMEEPGDDHFHVGKVAAMGDNLILDTYATTTASLPQAKWKPLEQIVLTEQYTLQR